MAERRSFASPTAVRAFSTAPPMLPLFADQVPARCQYLLSRSRPSSAAWASHAGAPPVRLGSGRSATDQVMYRLRHRLRGRHAPIRDRRPRFSRMSSGKVGPGGRLATPNLASQKFETVVEVWADPIPAATAFSEAMARLGRVARSRSERPGLHGVGRGRRCLHEHEPGGRRGSDRPAPRWRKSCDIDRHGQGRTDQARDWREGRSTGLGCS